jgi:hypothetical protein
VAAGGALLDVLLVDFNPQPRSLRNGHIALVVGKDFRLCQIVQQIIALVVVDAQTLTHLEDSTLNRDFGFGGAGGVGVVGATACNDLSDVMRSTIFQVKNESVSVASSAPTVSTKRSARESGRRTGFIAFNPLPDRNRDREMQTRNGVLDALVRPMLT